MKWFSLNPDHWTVAWYGTRWMRNVGIACVTYSLGCLAYVLRHLGLLLTAHPVGREVIWTQVCAIAFVVFGFNGAVILRRIWQYKRLK